MSPSPQLLLDAVQASGVRYELAPGWNDPRNAASGTWAPRYVILHHTANGGAAGDAPSLAWCVKGTYPPVRNCHLLVARSGLVHVVAGVKAYHAGKGGPGRWGNGPAVPLDSMNGYAYGIEIESKGTSTDPSADRGTNGYTPEQIAATAAVAAQLLDAIGSDAGCAINHRTWAPRRKTDTLLPDATWQQLIREAGTDVAGMTPEQIAAAVWGYKLPSTWDGGTKTAATLLQQAQAYAIQGGYIGTAPDAAASGAGKRTTAGVLSDQIGGIECQGTSSPGSSLSDADVDRIAHAVVELMGTSLSGSS